ncbi:MAG: squalene/phytoene synthase family protein [Ignavibacteria bacterium]|nr:squalene/phytoene synthase family protein [Ignavibacteria bacterium]
MNIDGIKLDIAYKHCRNITKSFAKTFYFTSFFLPVDKRKSSYAVYAFCRYMDDLVDRGVVIHSKETSEKEKIINAINTWKNDLRSVYNGDFIDNPIMIAWKDTLSKYHIPEKYPNELIDGVNMDLTVKRYENFDMLREYCYKVASVVGLMTIQIFGYAGTEAFKHAVDMGIAMQLTNILRDIKEDSQRNRIYIPVNELQEFGYSEEDLMNQKINDNFKKLMKFQIQRAEEYYSKADEGIRFIDKDSRLTVGLMSRNYRKILLEIQSNNYDIFSKRNYVPLYKKLINLPELYFRYKIA